MKIEFCWQFEFLQAWVDANTWREVRLQLRSHVEGKRCGGFHWDWSEIDHVTIILLTNDTIFLLVWGKGCLCIIESLLFFVLFLQVKILIQDVEVYDLPLISVFFSFFQRYRVT